MNVQMRLDMHLEMCVEMNLNMYLDPIVDMDLYEFGYVLGMVF